MIIDRSVSKVTESKSLPESRSETGLSSIGTISHSTLSVPRSFFKHEKKASKYFLSNIQLRVTAQWKQTLLPVCYILMSYNNKIRARGKKGTTTTFKLLFYLKSVSNKSKLSC